MQCSDFVENSINTGWLDQRIAANVRAEKPPWELCVIGAAAVRAHEAFACKAAEYLGFLSKGQLPPADISLIFFQVGWPWALPACVAALLPALPFS
jgi:acetyl-CoA carboxylase/biotin carboxylase 1